MYCKKCGMEIEDGTKYCPYCGETQGAQDEVMNDYKPVVDMTGNKWWGVLGFLFPIVGLILFIVWKNEQPLNAKYAGKGALISVIISVVLYVLLFCCAFIAGFTGALDGVTY